ncbi:MAG: cytochrome c biogenesis protein CcsA [Calditrichia bacterium]
MEFVISFLNTILPIFYFVSTYLYGMFFFKNDIFAEKYMSHILRFTVALHFAEVVLRGWYYQHFPLASIFESLSVLALAAIMIYLYLEIRLKVRTTGFFILVLVFVLQLISSAFISFTHDIPEILHSPYFAIHTSAAILGYSGLAISFLYSVMYLLLFHDIKGSRFGVIYNRLPSLETLAGLNYKAAAVGFSFLTLAILVGSYWSNKVFGQFFAVDPKILVAYLTWLIYGIELLGGRYLKWSSRRLAYLSLSGFGIILFSMIAVNLLMTSFHEFK